MSKTWREVLAPEIAKVIDRVGTKDMKLLRRELRDAFPMGPRMYWPYKVWLDEIRVQLGTKTKKKDRDCQGQGRLF